MLLTSCNEFVEVDPPRGELIRETIFENDATATAAISAIYFQMSNEGTSGFSSGGTQSLNIICGFSADELTWFSGTQNLNLQQFYENVIVPTNPVNGSIWKAAYTFIFMSNSIIEGVENSIGLTTAVKSQILGEAKFIRAFCHFYISNLYGDIPYVVTTDYRQNTQAFQIPKHQVDSKIIEDLLDAIELLPESYVSAGRARPNKWTATALLARVYLYAKDWVNAEIQSTAVINQNSNYSLTTTAATFLKNSNECIWQLIPPNNQLFTNEGRTFILSGSPGLVALSSNLINSFEAGDSRKDIWTKSVTTASGTFYYAFKYKENASNGTGKEYSIVLRLAEQYLIRAEARARQNKLLNANGAASDINTIRNRSGLPNTTAVTQDELLNAIAQERKVELFAEWGHRWLDLRRTDHVDKVLRPLKPEWTSTAAFYPIPETEILINGNLIQNDGY